VIRPTIAGPLSLTSVSKPPPAVYWPEKERVFPLTVAVQVKWPSGLSVSSTVAPPAPFAFQVPVRSLGGGPRPSALGGDHRQPIREDHRKGGPHGIDAWKRVSGRKRHLLVDALGLILAVVVTAASVQDDEGAKLLFGSIRGRFSRLRPVRADAIYKRAAGRVAAWRPAIPIRLAVVERTEPGFKVLPRRRVVERTFAWLGRNRRLSKDYEGTIASSEAFVKLAMGH
jgi:putative transposase